MKKILYFFICFVVVNALEAQTITTTGEISFDKTKVFLQTDLSPFADTFVVSVETEKNYYNNGESYMVNPPIISNSRDSFVVRYQEIFYDTVDISDPIKFDTLISRLYEFSTRMVTPGWRIYRSNVYLHYTEDGLILSKDSSLTVGIFTPNKQKINISVYPNPVSDQLNIVLPGNADAIISITSLAGQVIYFSRLSTIKTSIDVSSLKPGMYIVSFQNGGQQGTKTFIKQ
ncbi:MAG: T9SS type A sorting domain-containing protein [Candidatus Nomurabacteria bacterium]|nr:T9SS type A sorting domain-containing protein [Candidatus Nomurabacteria bacterium]